MSAQTPIQKLVEVLQIKDRSRAIHEARGLAYKRYQLQEAEFEALLQADDARADQVETERQKLISVYEQYIDACLALRTHSIEADKTIAQMIKDLEQ